MAPRPVPLPCRCGALRAPPVAERCSGSEVLVQPIASIERYGAHRPPASDLNERAAVAEAAIALGLGATSICGFCLPWPVDWPANEFGASGVLSAPAWAGAAHGERALAGVVAHRSEAFAEAARLGFREGW